MRATVARTLPAIFWRVHLQAPPSFGFRVQAFESMVVFRVEGRGVFNARHKIAGL